VVAAAIRARPKRKAKRPLWRRLLWWAALLAAASYGLCLLALVGLKWINPPTTMLQIERRVQAVLHHRAYRKRRVWVPLDRIAPDLRHAVIASEDERFYQHHGIDWTELNKVVDRDLDRGKLGRGASTITQQLVKNLFLTDSRSVVRKSVEFTIAPAADLILGKRRELELYLNIIEWGPGIYGAEAAARYYYGVPAARLSREQAARLAAIIPAPLTRKPARMDELSTGILEKMHNMRW